MTWHAKLFSDNLYAEKNIPGWLNELDAEVRWFAAVRSEHGLLVIVETIQPFIYPFPDSSGNMLAGLDADAKR